MIERIDDSVVSVSPIAKVNPEVNTEQRAKIFAALADPTRLRIVELLDQMGELSSSEIAGQLGISLALLCHHSKTLAEAGLIQCRKEGQTKFNSLNQAMLKACFESFNLGWGTTQLP